jgi:hypothetical protein
LFIVALTIGACVNLSDANVTLRVAVVDDGYVVELDPACVA